jgi:hypothetical protein
LITNRDEPSPSRFFAVCIEKHATGTVELSDRKSEAVKHFEKVFSFDGIGLAVRSFFWRTTHLF